MIPVLITDEVTLQRSRDPIPAHGWTFIQLFTPILFTSEQNYRLNNHVFKSFAAFFYLNTYTTV